MRNGVTKEDFQYYTRILQDALIENENVATNFPQRPTPIHPKSTSPANIIRAFSGQRASTVPIGSYTPHPSFASQPLQRGVRSPLFDSSARDFARQQRSYNPFFPTHPNLPKYSCAPAFKCEEVHKWTITTYFFSRGIFL